MLDGISTDLRFAWRSLRRSVPFTTFAVVILAVGIASTSALFSVLDQVVLRRLPFPKPEALVVIHEVLPGSITPRSPVSASHFQEWRARVRSLEHLALVAPMIYTLGGGSTPELVDGSRASASLFKTLGASAAIGRTFTTEEEQIGRNHVVVLSHDFWNGRFAADPRIVGRSLKLDGETYDVIGVLAPEFEFSNISGLYPMAVAAVRPNIWTPLGLHDSERIPNRAFNFACVARLAPRTSIESAATELNVVQQDIGRTAQGAVDLKASIVPLHAQLTAPFRQGVLLLVGAAVIVLFVACINISGLCLARGISRHHEFAIRQAAGATPWRLRRQLAAESLLVAAGGGAVGVALAPAVMRAISELAPPDLARIEQVSLDGRVLLFALASSLVCALVIAALPAWRSSTDASTAIRYSGKGVVGSSNRRLATLLLATETAASTACVIVALLLAASLLHVLDVNGGFDRERILAGELRMPAERYGVARASNLLRNMKQAMELIPGVAAVGISDRVVLKGEGGNLPIAPEGQNLSSLERPVASLQLADGEFFKALGIPMMKGRVFAETDRQRAPVAIVAVTAAERIWPGENVIGKRFRIGADTSVPFEIVGVVGDVRGVSLESDPRPSIYLPYWYAVIGQASLTVRTVTDPAAIVGSLHDVIRRLDPEMALPVFETIEQIVSHSTRERRFQMNLALVLAISALVLTALGIYSAVSQLTCRLARDLAVRIAIGAKAADIRRHVLGEALTPIAIGTAAGFAVALSIAPLLRGLLFGVSPYDFRYFALTGTVMLTAALVAGFVPALRASRQDPLVIMRSV